MTMFDLSLEFRNGSVHLGNTRPCDLTSQLVFLTDCSMQNANEHETCGGSEVTMYFLDDAFKWS